jgi:hypothetical protein
MKKILLVCGFLCIGTTIFAIDFRTYPEVIQNGTMLLDAGVGFGGPIYGSMGCPPLSLNFEYALPLFSLPFSFGLKFAYSADDADIGFVNNFGIALRTAYHFNFGVPHLDTYAALNFGDIISSFGSTDNNFWAGFLIGARYYFKYQSHLGVYFEAGIDKLSYVSFGGTARF